MKSFGVCFMLTSCLTIMIVTESTQEKNVHQFGDAITKDIAFYCRTPLDTNDGDAFVQSKTQFVDLPQSAKARTRAIVNLGGKRGNQFKNFMLGRETSKDAGNQAQKGSYIPVKSNGKREDLSPNVYGIYTGSNDMDVFQKWLSSYYLQ